MTGPRHYDLDEIRRRLRLSDLISGDVIWDARKTRAGAGDFWAPCPFHAEKTPSFHVVDRPERSFYHCFGCQEKGASVFDYVRRRDGCDFKTALEECARIAGVSPDQIDPVEQARRQAQRDADRVRRQREMERQDCKRRESGQQKASDIWRAARPDPMVETYLAARGIDLGAICGVPPSLRLARVRHFEAGRDVPAMVAPIQSAEGELIAAHCTFLAPDGRSKLSVAPAKKIFGPYWGGMVRLGPMAPVMAMAEGIETALAVMAYERARGCEITCWAAGSLGNMAGHADKTPQGACFPDTVQRVRIYADNDTKDRGTLTSAMEFAASRLREKGLGVDVITPPRGMDFLDFYNASKGETR